MFPFELMNAFCDHLDFPIKCGSLLYVRIGAVQQRSKAFVVVLGAVEIIDVTVFEQRHGPFPNLVRCSVVEAEFPAPPTDVNTAATQHHAMSVNPLVRVAYDEQVVRAT